ncbi:VOC family protein [Pinibacter soli]|uniref:VOC domain-containing protein n=1 Tax=Pinibacter soli TaxID=3044211 RepID=A0ABT6RED9_9BACT|nr:VOC family protein [Pinibacter soli]MDI3320893.1 hypothetical protein [Pinibacter soli]
MSAEIGIEMISNLLHSAVPVISTNDVQKALSFYINIPSLTLDSEYGEPVVYAGVKSGDVEIYFSYGLDIASLIKEQKICPEIFIWVSDTDKLFQKHLADGVNIIEPISDRAWGARQYVVKDINGYHLKFAQPI